MTIRIDGTNTAAAPGVTGADTDTGLQFGTNEVSIVTAGEEQVKVDSSGRLLVGVSSSSQVNTAVFQGNSAAGSAGAVILSSTINNPSSTQTIGKLAFSDNGHVDAASIKGTRDGGTWTSGSSQPTALKFFTTADGANSPTERMQISSEGYVTHPNPGVYLDSLDWTSSIAKMHLGHQFWQIGSNWNNSTGVWTCPVAGRYLVAADVQGHNTATQSGANGTYFNIQPYLNGAHYGAETVATQKGDSGGTSKHDVIAFTIILNCAENDTIEVRSNHGFRTNTQNHLTIYLLS